MDEKLAQAIIDLGVVHFGTSIKNKGDSKSCLFDPRNLLSSPEMLKYIGQKMAKVVKEKCQGDTLIGMATSGISWATVTSLYSGMPFLYVRKKLERHMSNKFIEGIIPKNGKLILIDDLLFAGESKDEAIAIIKDHGLTVTDIVVVVDRQLQRKLDGPHIAKKHNINLHSLITMEEIVDYMLRTQNITDTQLRRLVDDYRGFERWYLPKFAQI